MMAIGGPAAAARRFEDQLITQFAINPRCKGVTLARFYGPAEKASDATQAAIAAIAMARKDSWTLSIDYIVAASAQSWSLLDKDKNYRLFQAEGSTPAKIAADVCAIVTGTGGTVD